MRERRVHEEEGSTRGGREEDVNMDVQAFY